jgi:hypothetical protein
MERKKIIQDDEFKCTIYFWMCVFIIIINVGVRVSLRLSQLIL